MTPHDRRRPPGASEVRELGGLVRRTLLPTAVFLGVVLAGYGLTGHDLTIILQDRFPEDSEWSGLLTILFGSALMVAAGVALTGVVLARAGARTAAAPAPGHPAADPAVRAGLAVALLAVVIAFDDMMMIHDAVLPGSGISEDVGLAAYGLVGLCLAAWAFTPLRRVGLASVFLAAMALLGASVGGDVVEELLEGRSDPLAAVAGHAEDVVKFLAYAALCHLCVRLAERMTSTRPAPAVDGGGGTGTTPGADPDTVPLTVYAVVAGGASTPTPVGQATPVPASPQ